MTTSTRRTALAGAAKSKLRIVSPTPKSTSVSVLAGAAKSRALCNLEDQICDLDRAARIAFLMAMHDRENPDEECLGLFMVEHVERLAAELRADFYRALETEEVQS